LIYSAYHTTCTRTDSERAHYLFLFSYPPLSDFGIISYSFSRIAATIHQDTPFVLSPNVALLILLPTFVFVVLLLAYRYIQHPIFTYQRGGIMQAEEVPARNNSSSSVAGDIKVDEEADMGDMGDPAVETEKTVAEATAGKLIPKVLRMVVGLSDFSVAAIDKGGDKVLPGDVPARYRSGGGCGGAYAFHAYRLLWWYWQALKRNHSILAPFMAPYVPPRGHAHYSGLLLARYVPVHV